MAVPQNDDPQAQPQSAPGNTTPVSEQADPHGGTGQATAPGSQPSGSGSHTAANLHDAETSARAKQTHEQADKAEQRTARKKSHAEGLAVAHDNLGKEIDAIIGSMGQGNAVTLAQMQALRAAVVGCHGVAHKLASGQVGFDDEAPEAAK